MNERAKVTGSVYIYIMYIQFTSLKAFGIVIIVNKIITQWESVWTKLPPTYYDAKNHIEKYRPVHSLINPQDQQKDIIQRFQKLHDLFTMVYGSDGNYQDCLKFKIGEHIYHFQVFELHQSTQLIPHIEKDLESYRDLTDLDDAKFFSQYEQELAEIDPHRIFEDAANADLILKFYLQALLNQAYKETDPKRISELEFIQNDQFDPQMAIQIVKLYINLICPDNPILRSIQQKIDRLLAILSKRGN